MKKIITLSAALGMALLFSAHEFWLQPSTHFAEVGQPVHIQLKVGEGFEGEKWDAGKSRVTNLMSYRGTTQTDWLYLLQKKGLDSLYCRFGEAGTHLMALATNSKFIELEADKFNEYLREDGLDHVLKARQLRGDTLSKGREFYRREAATLIQVGNPITAVSFNQTRFDLKIIPLKHPLLQPSGTSLSFKITFKNKPLAYALVRHWHKANGKVDILMQRTDKNGVVRFTPLSGDNMVSVVHMVEHPNKTEADWQSIWGNLTFGIK